MSSPSTDTVQNVSQVSYLPVTILIASLGVTQAHNLVLLLVRYLTLITLRDTHVHESRSALQWCGIPIYEGDDLLASNMVGLVSILTCCGTIQSDSMNEWCCLYHNVHIHA